MLDGSISGQILLGTKYECYTVGGGGDGVDTLTLYLLRYIDVQHDRLHLTDFVPKEAFQPDPKSPVWRRIRNIWRGQKPPLFPLFSVLREIVHS